MNNAFKPKSVEEIENQIEKLRKSYTPEWKFDKANPDAGTVIAQIFARETEENNRLMSQMPERYHMEFVNMLDSTLRPAQPAASMVIFNLEGNSIMGTQVPKGTRLTAESDETESGFVIFETERNLYVTESQIKCAFMTDAEDGTITPLYGKLAAPDIVPSSAFIGEEEDDRGGAAGTDEAEEDYFVDRTSLIPPFTLFGEKKTIGRSILIMYHDRLFDGVDEPIYIRLEGAEALIDRIEKGEFVFKYLEKKEYLEFDHVRLLEDKKTYELVKRTKGTKVRLGESEVNVVILENKDVMTDYLEIENVLISAAGDSKLPEYVGDGSTEFEVSKFNNDKLVKEEH